jgi:hypothetical protein
MAMCEWCAREMLVADSCLPTPLTLDGIAYEQVRFGDEVGWRREPERCHDCNVVRGAVHHPLCDVQLCPICQRQLGVCGHDFEELDELGV